MAMKLKILGLVGGAAALALASTAASADTDVYIGLDFGTPYYVEREPVYYHHYESAPVYEYRYYEPAPRYVYRSDRYYAYERDWDDGHRHKHKHKHKRRHHHHHH